jgi:S1-C subfamily serine protease
MLRYLSTLAVAVCLTAVPQPAPAGAAKEPAKKGYFGIQIRKDQESGSLVIVGLFEGSPARKAGLQPGDTLLRVDGLRATDLATTVRFITSLKPGEKVRVRVRRDGEEKDIEVTVGAA